MLRDARLTTGAENALAQRRDSVETVDTERESTSDRSSHGGSPAADLRLSGAANGSVHALLALKTPTLPQLPARKSAKSTSGRSPRAARKRATPSSSPTARKKKPSTPTADTDGAHTQQQQPPRTRKATHLVRRVRVHGAQWLNPVVTQLLLWCF